VCALIVAAVDSGKSATKVQQQFTTMIKCLTLIASVSSQTWTYFLKFWKVWFYECTTYIFATVYNFLYSVSVSNLWLLMLACCILQLLMSSSFLLG